MSTTLAPPPPAVAPARPAPDAALGGPPAPSSSRRFGARDAIWFAAFAALLGLSLVRWVGLLAAPPILAMLGLALANVAVAVGLALIPRPGARAIAAVVAAVLLVGGTLLAAGLPLWLLDPRDWGTLVPGIGDAISALPGVNVPYKGQGDWVRITIATGGGLLAIAAALAAGLGRRGLALLAIVVLFAIPAIQISCDHPWIVGAAFTVPLFVALLAPRLPVRLAGVTIGLVAAAVVVGVAAGPLLDGDGPIVDVQHLASDLEPAQSDQFDWDHGYGPIDWPRDGRELLRVRADRASYWKAEDLDVFDGTRWHTDSSDGIGTEPATEGMDQHPQWRDKVRVTVEGMQTRDFIAPGEAVAISRAPRQPVATRPGGFSVATDDEPLKSGSAYLAESYVPRPRPAELRRSPAIYPGYLGSELTMLTPPDGSNARTLIHFPAFGSDGIPIALGPGVAQSDAVRTLDYSGYGRMYELAQRLAAGARTPYDVVQNVQRYLSNPRFVYDEKVPARRLALPAFLFDTHAGYCQHFSGAMALLLRMAGVPARVSAGFTTGQADKKSGEYVVRDTDAHSWVEVWFAGIGWATFDPTPSQAPARARSAAGALSSVGPIPTGPTPSGAIGGGSAKTPGDSAAPAAPADSGGSAWPWVGLGAALIAAAAAARALWRRRERTAADAGPDPEVAELERALRRSGRPLGTDTTLRDLETRFAGQPGARNYVRAVARRRYAGAGAGPTRAERRALRHALGRDLGVTGRLRAWWAVPPRLLR